MQKIFTIVTVDGAFVGASVKDGALKPLPINTLSELDSLLSESSLSAAAQLEEQKQLNIELNQQLATAASEKNSIQSELDLLKASQAKTLSLVSDLGAAFDKLPDSIKDNPIFIQAFGTVRILLDAGRKDLAIKFVASITQAPEEIRNQILSILNH